MATAHIAQCLPPLSPHDMTGSSLSSSSSNSSDSTSRSRTNSSSSSNSSSNNISSSSSSSNSSSSNNNKTNSKRNKSALPPCKVCGNQGTGFHYGANTCEACKGFFRRSILRTKSYNCRGDERLCRIQPHLKSLCPHCRFRKCLDIGMSIEGIKTGRYTLEKKRKDTMEMKSLALQQAQQRQLREVAAKQQSSHRLVEAIMTRFWKTFSDVIDMEKYMPGILEDFVDVRRIQDDLFGPTHPVPHKEFIDTLEKTGQQVDDRLDIMNAWFQSISPLLERRVKFLKSIQGFKALDLGDQIALVKASWVETWLADHHYAVSTEHRCYTFAFGGMSIELDKVLGQELGGSIISVVRRLQLLRLTMEECVLLHVLLVFSPDQPGLKAPDQIAAIQEQLLDALLWMLGKNHPNDKLIFPRLISAMTEMKNTQDLASREIRNYLINLVEQGYIHAPQIFREIIICP